MRSSRRVMSGYRLRGAGEDEVRDLLQLGGAGRGGLAQRPARGAVTLLREYPRTVQPELADVGALAQSLVAAVRLAEGHVGARHVEDVVDDLEEHAELGGEAPPRGGRLFIHAGQQQYADHRGRDEPARLELV